MHYVRRNVGWQVNEPFQDLVASLVAAISEGEQPAESIGQVVAIGGGVANGLTLKRGPVKKPARALQKLVRVYQPTLFCVVSRVEFAILASVQRYHVHNAPVR